jgi:hypothetical protein
MTRYIQDGEKRCQTIPRTTRKRPAYLTHQQVGSLAAASGHHWSDCHAA